MTDLTDPDRRRLRDDAKAVINKTATRSSAAVSIARYVLDTVEAPELTLAEELRYLATPIDNGDPDGTATDRIRIAADRVEQIEQEVAEADRDRDEALRWVDNLTGQRDEARAEVERLKAIHHPPHPPHSRGLHS